MKNYYNRLNAMSCKDTYKTHLEKISTKSKRNNIFDLANYTWNGIQSVRYKYILLMSLNTQLNTQC